jgi:hypothetical protein
VSLFLQINAHLYLPPSSSSSTPIQPAGSSAAAHRDKQQQQQQQQRPVRPTDPGCYSLDVLRGYSLLMSSGGGMSDVEQLVMGLTVGGAAQKR